MESIPANGEFNINVEFNASTDAEESFMFVASYDAQGKLITLTKESLTSEIIESGTCSLQMNPTNGTIDTIKIFVWNSLNLMQPKAEPYIISN